MRFPIFLCFALLFGILPGAVFAGVLIEVDKSTQRMKVTVDGQERHSWPVSTRLAKYATPAGSYTPFRLEEDHRSKEWDDAPMPHSIFFTSRGHAIHGSDATRRLGSPASHGCVRLSRANAAAPYALVQQEGLGNTKVVVRGDEAIVLGRRSRQARAEAAPRRAPAARARAGRPSEPEWGYGSATSWEATPWDQGGFGGPRPSRRGQQRVISPWPGVGQGYW
jgi:hypothetical protein